jgi:hypothetical protein
MIYDAETEGVVGGDFTPFSDSDDHRQSLVAAVLDQSGSGYDTSGIDAYRQGVEIRTAKHLYLSSIPKIWAGNLEHAVSVITYGQARSWTDYENSASFNDMDNSINQGGYDPALYLRNLGDYTTLYFNDGPMEEEEAILEPFTIPFRREVLEGANPLRQIHASLEDGNVALDDLKFGTTRIIQFIEYGNPANPRYFLDAGQTYIGPSVTQSIMREGQIPILVRNLKPFNDQDDELIVAQITASLDSGSSTFIAALKTLNIELDEDIRETYAQKSATAGYDSYGSNQARYGTDSLTHNGWLRGS